MPHFKDPESPTYSELLMAIVETMVECPYPTEEEWIEIKIYFQTLHGQLLSIEENKTVHREITPINQHSQG